MEIYITEDDEELLMNKGHRRDSKRGFETKSKVPLTLHTKKVGDSRGVTVSRSFGIKFTYIIQNELDSLIDD